jgi:hypothetical protein
MKELRACANARVEIFVLKSQREARQRRVETNGCG